MASRSTRSRRPTTPRQQPEPQSRAKWTASLTKVLANLMVDQVHKGNKQNNTFGKKAWKCICEEFHKNTDLNWDKEQLKNRYAVLRKQFVITKSLLDEPDFKWDEPTGAIVATNEAWNKYIPVCYFCFWCCINYDTLHLLFGGTTHLMTWHKTMGFSGDISINLYPSVPLNVAKKKICSKKVIISKILVH